MLPTKSPFAAAVLALIVLNSARAPVAALRLTRDSEQHTVGI